MEYKTVYNFRSIHSILSVAQEGCSLQGQGHGSGGGGITDEAHLGNIDGASSGQNETIITKRNHDAIAATSENPATRSPNIKFINAINSVSAI